MTTIEVQRRVEKAQQQMLKQLEGAQKQLRTLEKEVLAFGRTRQRELGRLAAKVRSGAQLKALGKRAQGATRGLRAHLDAMEQTVLTAVGVASSEQVRKLATEVSRLKKDLAKLSKSLPQA